MVFNIRQNATLPILKMEVIKDGRNDFNKLESLLPNAAVTFSMKDSKTGIYKIVNLAGEIYMKEPCTEDGKKEYYIGYQFTANDTKTPGIYIGQFKLNMFDDDNTLYGELFVPIKEELYIHITDGFVRSDVVNY